MDFVDCFPLDVVDLIFQHLTGKEVLDATLVSSDWNSYLSKSNCFNKIVIKPTLRKASSDLESLINSTRKYRHMHVVNGSAINSEIVEIVSNPYCKFNTVIIFRTIFDEKKQIEKIFLNTAATLKRLELHCNNFVRDDGKDKEKSSYNFPNLETFKLRYDRHTIPWINEFVSGFPQLKDLTLIDASDERMKKLILKAPKLKRLELAGQFFDVNFYKHLSEQLPPRVEEYIFNDILSSSHEDENLSYFNAFFSSQSATLRRFETDALLEPEEFETAFNMPNLHELQIKGFQYQMQYMEFYMERIRSVEHSAANLKIFTVNIMDHNLFELMALHAKNLKVLKIGRLLFVNLSDSSWFSKLETLEIEHIDEVLKLVLQSKPVEKRSHLEKMILSSIAKHV